jgi:hypothetical protein
MRENIFGEYHYIKCRVDERGDTWVHHDLFVAA